MGNQETTSDFDRLDLRVNFCDLLLSRPTLVVKQLFALLQQRSYFSKVRYRIGQKCGPLAFRPPRFLEIKTPLQEDPA